MMTLINEICDLCFYKTSKPESKEFFNEYLNDMLDIDKNIRKDLEKMLFMANKPNNLLTVAGVIKILEKKHPLTILRLDIRRKLKDDSTKTN